MRYGFGTSKQQAQIVIKQGKKLHPRSRFVIRKENTSYGVGYCIYKYAK